MIIKLTQAEERKAGLRTVSEAKARLFAVSAKQRKKNELAAIQSELASVKQAFASWLKAQPKCRKCASPVSVEADARTGVWHRCHKCKRLERVKHPQPKN